MARLPKVKLRAIPVFPTNVAGATGIDVTKTNGIWTITLDVADFHISGVAVADSATTYAIAFGGVTTDNPGGSYSLVPFDGFQAVSADLTSLSELGTFGIVARIGDADYVTRTITAGTGIGVTNGGGIAGNPTVAVTDVELLALAGLTSAADRLPYFTGSGTASLATFTAFARTLVDDADAATARATLGLTSPSTATPSALTKTDDTNVTLTLGGTPATALLQAASIAAGWSGTLAVTRGGTGAGSASGTALDNITGFASTGILVRTASGTYAFRIATGTANRITVTNGDGVSGNQTFDISTSYVGQATITTLGTVTTGTWNATAIGSSKGGFGSDISASSGVPLFAAGVPTFTSTTGAGKFARETSATLVTTNLTAPVFGDFTDPTKQFQFSLTGITTGTARTWTIQNSDDTFVGRATTDTLTNKSLTSPTLTGTPVTPTAAVDTNTTQIASTAFVLAQAGSATPIVDGAGTVGTSTRFARQDHVHPTDTSRAALASPALTGVPTAPTATPATNTTQIATTAYADAIAALKADLASPTFTGTPAAPTAAAGTNTTQIATTAGIVAERSATKTLTNTTYDTAGTGNSFSINGVAATANSGTGAVARVAGPTFTTPTLGVATATTLNGNTFTTGTYTLTGTAGKTFTFSNTLTLAGTDGTTMTFPTTSATLARTDAANTFAGTQVFSSTITGSISGSAATLTTARAIDGQNFDGSAAITVIAPGTHAATTKTTPVDADEVPLVDSAASNVLKKLTWANLKATLKTYFDTLYVPVANTPKNPTIQIFTSSGTWTKPAGCTAIEVELVGAGGGSGGVAATGAAEIAISGSGAGGGYSRKRITTAGGTETVTIGAGGTAGTAGNNAGGNGGTTSFGAHCQATGGNGGNGGANAGNVNGVQAAAGVGSSGDFNTTGQPSGPTSGIITGGVQTLNPAFGGGSLLGGGGAGATPGVGTAGQGYGGGAGSSSSISGTGATRAGAAGKDGIVIVREYYGS